MKSPVGMEEIDPGSSSEDCYQLLKGLYGLCQAVRQFWKKFVNTVKQEPFGFQVSPAVPCMLFKKNELGVCIKIMYVDDMLVIEKKEQIQDFSSKIQKKISVKIQHNLTDYLGCEFHMNRERTRGWLEQPSIIKSLEQKFGDRAMKERLSQTPGTPRFTARRLENPEDKVNPEEHETYRIGVGTTKEYQEDGKIIIKFVKSEENETDIFTKNTTNVIFHNHQKKLVWDKTNVDNEMKTRTYPK